jgi:phosphoglycerate dehydrogenase-like enzyme
MKPTAVLVNTARGPIVDEAALVEALLAGKIAGAAIDVYGTEPLPASHPLLGCQTAFLTAHTGWVTDTAYNGFVEGVVGNIEAYLAGNPTNVKNPDALAVAR